MSGVQGRVVEVMETGLAVVEPATPPVWLAGMGEPDAGTPFGGVVCGELGAA